MRKELIAQRDPKSPISEIFRTLRTNIQFMNSNKELKTLLVTSTIPTEGKSWVSSNLAVTFAQAGLKVVLIDADMRKGRLHKMFEIISRPGLSNYLSGVTETNQEKGNIANFLRETEIPNLYVMPAGNIPPNPSELLVTPQMIILLEELKRQTDLVIIDATPAKLVTDAAILSRIVDSTIIVAAHNQTKKDELAKTVRDIKNVGGNIAGIVYNKVPVQAKEYYESYYYVSDSENKKRHESSGINENSRAPEPARRPVTRSSTTATKPARPASAARPTKTATASTEKPVKPTTTGIKTAKPAEPKKVVEEEKEEAKPRTRGRRAASTSTKKAVPSKTKSTETKTTRGRRKKED